MKLDINKFSFAQMTSNSADGKTSGSGAAGVFITAAGILGFILGIINYFIDGKTDIMTQSIIVITLGASLLGYRKSRSDKPKEPKVETPADETLNS